MPAIQPARLKQQASLLAQHFDDPDAFVRSLHYLLEYYADRARRPGQSGTPSPLIKSFNIRPPVLKQLTQELTPLVQDFPEQGLALCDCLWNEPYLEFRILAANLLGGIPPELSEIIVGRVQVWLANDLDSILIDSLLIQSLSGLRGQEPAAYLNLIKEWINSDKDFYNQMGLRALLPLIKDPSFENLPIFYKLIQHLARSSSPAVKPDLLDVISALAVNSPSETAYFLRHTLNTPQATDTAWIIRQVLHVFPPEIAKNLRTMLREFRDTAK